MFFIKIYIKESYINYYDTSIQMCGQYCILAPRKCAPKLRKRKRSHLVMAVALQQFQQAQFHQTCHKPLWGKRHKIHREPAATTETRSSTNGMSKE